MSNLANNECNSFVAVVDVHSASGSMPPTAVLPISDPCTGEKRQYLAHKPVMELNSQQQHIYEVQSLPHPRSSRSAYSSFFINSRVVSNPHLHLVTPIDPLYLLLPYFETGDKWQPWNQIAQAKNIPSEIMNAIKTDQLKHFFMVNDSYGDDMILYKFKREKALEWLEKKMERVEIFVMKQFLSKKKKDKIHEVENGGAFSSSFHLSDSVGRQESDVTPSKNDKTTKCIEELTPSNKELVHRSAAQVICEYLPDNWQIDFLTKQGLTANALSKKKQKSNSACGSIEQKSNVEVVTPPSTSSKRPFMSESKISEADKLMQYTMGNDGIESEEKSSKKKRETQKSVGLKRLSKVNTKGEIHIPSLKCEYLQLFRLSQMNLLSLPFTGMKSMTSFFSVKANKKA
jgi:hypothetical protein